MRNLLVLTAALALIPAAALAQVQINRSQTGPVGAIVTATDPSGNTGKVVMPGVIAYDSTGTEKGTSGNPIITQAAAGTTNQVQGNVASAATDSGNPVKVGCAFNTTPPTLTTGQRVDAQCGARGSLDVTLFLQDATTAIGGRADNADGDAANATSSNLRVVARNTVFNGTTWDRAYGDTSGAAVQHWGIPANRWSFAVATGGIVNTTTAVTIKAAAGAAVRNYLNSCQIDHDALGAVTELVFRDGASGTVIARKKLQVTAVEGGQVTFATPLRGTANTLMEVATLTAVTGGVFVNCQGYQGP